MMPKPQKHGWLLRLASKVLKAFLLGLFGVGIALLLAAALGVFPLIELLMRFLEGWLMRVTLTVICLLATAVVLESAQ